MSVQTRQVRPGGQNLRLHIIFTTCVPWCRGRGCSCRLGRRGMGGGVTAEGVTPSNPDLSDPLGAIWALSSVNRPALQVHTKQSSESVERGWRKALRTTPHLGRRGRGWEEGGRGGGAGTPADTSGGYILRSTLCESKEHLSASLFLLLDTALLCFCAQCGPICAATPSTAQEHSCIMQ